MVSSVVRWMPVCRGDFGQGFFFLGQGNPLHLVQPVEVHPHPAAAHLQQYALELALQVENLPDPLFLDLPFLSPQQLQRQPDVPARRTGLRPEAASCHSPTFGLTPRHAAHWRNRVSSLPGMPWRAAMLSRE